MFSQFSIVENYLNHFEVPSLVFHLYPQHIRHNVAADRLLLIVIDSQFYSNAVMRIEAVLR